MFGGLFCCVLFCFLMALDKLTFPLIYCRVHRIPKPITQSSLAFLLRTACGKQAQLLEPSPTQASYVLGGLNLLWITLVYTSISTAFSGCNPFLPSCNSTIPGVKPVERSGTRTGQKRKTSTYQVEKARPGTWILRCDTLDSKK